MAMITAYRYTNEIAAARAELDKLIRLQYEADLVTPIQIAIGNEFIARTGVIPDATKFYIAKDEKSVLVTFRTNLGQLLWYDRPSKCGKNHEARIPVNFSSEDIKRVVDLMVANYIEDVQRILNVEEESMFWQYDDILSNIADRLRWYHMDISLKDYLRYSAAQIELVIHKLGNSFVEDETKAKEFLINKLGNGLESHLHEYLENGAYQKYAEKYHIVENVYNGFNFGL